MDYLKLLRVALVTLVVLLSACSDIIKDDDEDEENSGNNGNNNDTTEIVDGSGEVQLRDVDGTTSTATVTIGDAFENSSAGYLLNVTYNEDGEQFNDTMIIVLTDNGTGIITFVEGEDDSDTNPITWSVNNDGYLEFTEMDSSGDQWFWTLINIVSDSSVGNVLVDVHTPEGQDDSVDATVIGSILKLAENPDVTQPEDIVDTDGVVEFMYADGTTSSQSVVLAEAFAEDSIVGIYHLKHQFDGELSEDPIVLTINSNGSGTIKFDVDDINPIEWEVDDNGYLLVTENPLGDDQWFWTVINVVADDMNVVVDVYTPEGQQDAADYTSFGLFEKQSSDVSVAISADDVPGNYVWIFSETEAYFTFLADGSGTVHWPAEDDEPMGHPGYNDTFTWMVNGSGQLELELNQEEFDLYTLESGSLDDGIMTLATKQNANDDYMIEGSFPWVSTDDSYVSNALVGVYVLGSGDDYNVLAILDNSRYYVGHTKNTENSNAVSGEFGGYSWNDTTNTFQATIFGESDGQGGIGSDPETWTVSGNTLTIDEDNIAGNGDEIMVDKLTYTDGSIVGAWYLEEDGLEDYNIVVFLDDGRYFVMHSNNKEGDDSCPNLPVSGEHGTYTVGNDGLISTSVIAESDCQGGFTDESIKLTAHSDGYLEADSDDDGETDFILTRIE